ncbi:MAG TPA: hypothetical protein VJX67_25485 [Blastocatellia bacterium]|nr:hypothetical protein [Blastocatellia bacterium]
MEEFDGTDVSRFISGLPDPSGVRIFLERLERLHPECLASLRESPIWLSRVLTLAAYSPSLGEVMLSHPDHIDWLKREAGAALTCVKSVEQLSEEFARFGSRAASTGLVVCLAAFKQRELLRIYLRDCLGLGTLSEVTEELSNLADLVLREVLVSAERELIKAYGQPLTRDEKGKIANAGFAIIALGKLGCRELNYSSDVDLLLMYSGAGETSESRVLRHAPPQGGTGLRGGRVSNKEFFTLLARQVVRLAGSADGDSGDLPIYRIDLRLRPYGRDGDLVSDVKAAYRYYQEKAHPWERQALIRARAVAGNEAVSSEFIDLIKDIVFRPAALPDAIDGMKRARAKLEEKVARSGAYNVKLGLGGIREIEFITQALQLTFGGHEPWIRAAQTEIVLARLAEKGLLSHSDRSRLAAAYVFLRTVEHRLQMEQGTQTHTLPSGQDRLTLLARRCGYNTQTDPAAAFLKDLGTHTSTVRAIYDRVVGSPSAILGVKTITERAPIATAHEGSFKPTEAERLTQQAAGRLGELLSRYSVGQRQGGWSEARIGKTIEEVLPRSINPARSLRNLLLWAESLTSLLGDRPDRDSSLLSEPYSLVRSLVVALSCPYLARILIPRPALAASLRDGMSIKTPGAISHGVSDYLIELRPVLEKEQTPSEKADALRRAWHPLMVRMAYRDVANIPVTTGAVAPSTSEPGISESQAHRTLRLSNLEQTAVAEAILELALEIAADSMGLTEVEMSDLPFAILGLGRLGHCGMDYGSDLDLLVVYDETAPWPPSPKSGSERGPDDFSSAPEFYSKLTAGLVRVLSTITREGSLYRVDLRLRPEGEGGTAVQSLKGIAAYVSGRASAWEHSAYLKVREVAGHPAFGQQVRKAMISGAFAAAATNASLKEDLRRTRLRLEKEKARSSGRDIKWGPGGMTDVYFVTRYVQLRDQAYFPPERGTTELILELERLGSLPPASARTLFDGYWFLRRLDHWIRLLVDNAGPMLPTSHVVMEDIARAMGEDGHEALERLYLQHTSRIRDVYNQEFG